MRAVTLTMVPVKSILSMSYSIDTRSESEPAAGSKKRTTRVAVDMALRKNQRDWFGARGRDAMLPEGIKMGWES